MKIPEPTHIEQLITRQGNGLINITELRTIKFVILLIVTAVSYCMQLRAANSVLVDTDKDKARYELITKMSNSQLFDRGIQFIETNPDSSLLYFDILSLRYSSLVSKEDARLCARALFQSGKLYYEHFNYSKAMESLLRCRKLCEDNEFNDILSDAYRMIGNIYSIHADYERAIHFYDESLDLSLLLADKQRTHMVLSNLVGANIFLGNIDKADEYYARLCRNKLDEVTFRYDILVDGGLLAMHKGNNDEALRMHKEAVEYAVRNNLGDAKTGAAYSWIASIYDSMGKPDSALHYLHINEALARKSKQYDLLAETLISLFKVYKKNGDRNRSQEYLEEYVSLSEDVFNQKIFNNLKNTQFQYELDKSSRIIQGLNNDRMRQEMDIKQHRTILWIAMVGILILSVLLFIIYRQKRHISTAYNDLFDRNRANLDNEKIYKNRIRELQQQLMEEAPATDDVAQPESGQTQPTPGTLNITPELRKRLERDIAAAMDRSELFCDPTFTINRLAEEIGSNTTYVSKIINETYGMNFRAFLNEYRIKESMTRLGNNEIYSNYTIKAIAESVGFKSQSAFIAAFSKFTGMKPSKYQEIARRQLS